MKQKRPKRKDSLYSRCFHVVFTKRRESPKPGVPPAVEPGILPADSRADFAVTCLFRVPVPAGKMRPPRQDGCRYSRKPTLYTPKPGVGLVQIEEAGIELVVQPLFHLFVLRIFRVSHRFQQFIVTADAAAVFRRTVVRPRQTRRRPKPGFGERTFSTTTSCSQLSPKSYS